MQLANKGLSLVEVLSMCPVNWGLNPNEACKFIEEQMITRFPLGKFK